MVETVADGEIALTRGPRELVPGTGQLAVVAAVDAITDGAPEFRGDGAFEFDGEIGDAAARVQPVGGDDGAGGAGGMQALQVPQCAVATGSGGSARSR